MSNGGDAGDGQPNPTGGTPTGSVLDFIPADKKADFDRMIQEQVDKGVNIGFARANEKWEAKEKADREKRAKEGQGAGTPAPPASEFSPEELEFLRPLAKKAGSLKKVFDVYGTNDPEEIAKILEEAELAELSEAEKKNRESEKRYEELQDSVKLTKKQLKEQQEEAAAKLAFKEKREAALKRKLEDTIVTKAIKEAAQQANAYDPDDIIQGVKKFINLEETGEDDSEYDYTIQVVDDKKTPKLKVDGTPYTIADMVEEYLVQRPHLRKSVVKSGTGSTPRQQGRSTPAGVAGDVSFLNGVSLNDLADPQVFQKHSQDIQRMIRSGKLTSR